MKATVGNGAPRRLPRTHQVCFLYHSHLTSIQKARIMKGEEKYSKIKAYYNMTIALRTQFS